MLSCSAKKNNSQFTKKNIEIVVARYQENIDWLSEYYPFVTIYNKGDSDFPEQKKLDNVGRESHTYLTHIIDNWDNLADKTFFCQGNVSDHPVFPTFKYLFNKEDLKINLDCHNSTCYQFWGHIINGHLLGLDHSPYTFGQWWIQYVKKPIPHPSLFQWASGANFSVSRDLIKQNSLEYYQHLRNSLRNCPNPEEGHYFERSWFYIFDQGLCKSSK